MSCAATKLVSNLRLEVVATGLDESRGQLMFAPAGSPHERERMLNVEDHPQEAKPYPVVKKEKPKTKLTIRIVLFVAAFFQIYMFVWGIYYQISASREDKHNAPYLRNPIYYAAPNCPTSAAGITTITSIPARCDDHRYQIRYRNDLPDYHLPYLKVDHWLRIGPDAVAILGCSSLSGARVCDIHAVVRNSFPCCAKQEPLVQLKFGSWHSAG